MDKSEKPKKPSATPYILAIIFVLLAFYKLSSPDEFVHYLKLLAGTVFFRYIFSLCKRR